jgi:Na+-translocating ferredoxin:NAD+ oxidoreductase subunit A
MEYIVIIIGAVFVNNIVLAQFLGICPYLGVSAKVSTSIGMSGAVMFVMTLATLVTFLIYNYVLVPFDITYLQTISYILVIASLVQMVELILKKVSPALYQALGIFLPLIVTNCAILGVTILAVRDDFGFNLLQSVVFAIGNALGFALTIVLFAGIREHLDLMEVPKGMRGAPAALVVAGILALAFMGFANLV